MRTAVDVDINAGDIGILAETFGCVYTLAAHVASDGDPVGSDDKTPSPIAMKTTIYLPIPALNNPNHNMSASPPEVIPAIDLDATVAGKASAWLYSRHYSHGVHSLQPRSITNYLPSGDPSM